MAIINIYQFVSSYAYSSLILISCIKKWQNLTDKDSQNYDR